MGGRPPPAPSPYPLSPEPRLRALLTLLPSPKAAALSNECRRCAKMQATFAASSLPPSCKAFCCFCGRCGIVTVLSHRIKYAPGSACSLTSKLLLVQAGCLAAVSGRFCEFISFQRSGYGGWKEHVCLPDPCLTPLQATCKMLGAEDGKKETGGKVL